MHTQYANTQRHLSVISCREVSITKQEPVLSAALFVVADFGKDLPILPSGTYGVAKNLRQLSEPSVFPNFLDRKVS